MKRGLLVVNGGSSYSNYLERAIIPTEQELQGAFTEFSLYRAFLSLEARKSVEKELSQTVASFQEALDKMKADRITEILVQPIQFVPDKDYQQILAILLQEKKLGLFNKIALGRTLLHYNGQTDRPDDFTEVAQLLARLLPDPDPREAVVLVGRGVLDSANSAYELLGLRMQRRWPWIHIATLEGGLGLKEVVPSLKAGGYLRIHLIPLMWGAGRSAHKQIAGDTPASFKNILESEGFHVVSHVMGMGEWPEMRELFINRAKEAWESSDLSLFSS